MGWCGRCFEGGCGGEGGGLELEEIFEQCFAVSGQDGFGMELHAMDGEFTMSQSHDFLFICFGGDFEAVGQRLAFDDQRVVTGGLEGFGKSGEDAAAVVVHE